MRRGGWVWLAGGGGGGGVPMPRLVFSYFSLFFVYFPLLDAFSGLLRLGLPLFFNFGVGRGFKRCKLGRKQVNKRRRRSPVKENVPQCLNSYFHIFHYFFQYFPLLEAFLGWLRLELPLIFKYGVGKGFKCCK